MARLISAFDLGIVLSGVTLIGHAQASLLVGRSGLAAVIAIGARLSGLISEYGVTALVDHHAIAISPPSLLVSTVTFKDLFDLHVHLVGARQWATVHLSCRTAGESGSEGIGHRHERDGGHSGEQLD